MPRKWVLNKRHTAINEQIIEETVADETESTVTAESITDETPISFFNQPESSQLECSEIV